MNRKDFGIDYPEGYDDSIFKQRTDTKKTAVKFNVLMSSKALLEVMSEQS